jgi:hypothetical protein
MSSRTYEYSTSDEEFDMEEEEEPYYSLAWTVKTTRRTPSSSLKAQPIKRRGFGMLLLGCPVLAMISFKVHHSLQR